MLKLRPSGIVSKVSSQIRFTITSGEVTHTFLQPLVLILKLRNFHHVPSGENE